MESAYIVKNDKYYWDKILEDMHFIILHMKDETKDSLENNPILIDSMMFRLIQISENAKHLSEDVKEKNGDIPWMDIYGLRNRIVHDYGNVDYGVVYDTLKYDIPEVAELMTIE